MSVGLHIVTTATMPTSTTISTPVGPSAWHLRAAPNGWRSISEITLILGVVAILALSREGSFHGTLLVALLGILSLLRLCEYIAGGSFKTSQTLLTEIDKGFSEPWWDNYRQLVARRESGSIQPDELRELMALTDTLEEVNSRRIACFQAVGDSLGIGLAELMDEAGLKPRQV